VFSNLKKLLKQYLLDRKNYKFFIRNYTELRELQRAADVMNTLRHAQILHPALTTMPSNTRISVVAPHPDDEIMGPGGALALALANGCKASVTYLTNGNPSVDGIDPASESVQVAKVWGYKTKFLGLPLRAIPIDANSMEALAFELNKNKPELLWLPFLLDDHDDHRRASELLAATYRAGLLEYFPRIWAYQVYTCLPANIMIDITSVSEKKRKAIDIYVSQGHVRDWDHYILGLNAFNSRFFRGNEKCRYAELFFELPFKDYVELCEVYFRDPSSECYDRPAYRLP
jgi:LmbE family N-acetylglucosaminyl deacetylase